jgi:hypothetical protein
VVSLGGNSTDSFAAIYGFGFALRACGIWVSLSRRSFLGGSIIGASAGLVGWVTVLNLVERGMRH